MEEGVTVANFPTNFPRPGFPFPLPYEPIVLPDNSSRVVGTARDQATMSMERALLPVESEPPNPFGQRVYIDTQAVSEPKNAAIEAAITEQMNASRYEEEISDSTIEPETIEIVGEQVGGITRSRRRLPAPTVTPTVAPTVTPTPVATGMPWLLIGVAAVGAWLLLRKKGE